MMKFGQIEGDGDANEGGGENVFFFEPDENRFSIRTTVMLKPFGLLILVFQIIYGGYCLRVVVANQYLSSTNGANCYSK
jgi:hypothetical protein